MDKAIPLGKPTEYVFTYDASVLFAVPRVQAREALGFTELPFYGVDIWTAYELSWLNEKGRPQVAVAQMTFACDAPNIVESKSLKLYCNGFNQTVFVDHQALIHCMEKDLAICSGKPVKVELFAANNFPIQQAHDYLCLDDLDVHCEHYDVEPQLLSITETQEQASLCSHLFRSLCPVTAQPDWASIYIDYQGKALDKASLLRYLISYRNHQGFHEQCVEMIFRDVLALTQASKLTVSARFLRRGGLDINPIRSTQADFALVGRQTRQ